VQDHTHYENVGTWQWVREEVAGAKADAVAQTKGCDVLVENRTNGWEIEPFTGQVGICQRDLHRKASLGGADIGEALVL
jgi:hypothetical protein